MKQGIVDGERKTEGSVEEFILEAFRRVYKVGKPGNWGIGGRVQVPFRGERRRGCADAVRGKAVCGGDGGRETLRFE